jgi:hypothetical protein
MQCKYGAVESLQRPLGRLCSNVEMLQPYQPRQLQFIKLSSLKVALDANGTEGPLSIILIVRA